MSDQTCAPIAPPTFSWQRLLFATLSLVIVYVLLSYSGILTFSPEVQGATSLGGVFLVGIVAALSSCTAMVTGLVAAVSSTQVSWRGHVWFNLGRLLGFAAFGALIGWLGQVLQLSASATGITVLVIALLMITLGAHLMNLWPRGLWFFAPPKWLTTMIVKLSSSKRPGVPLLLGALTFFLPCGFTQSMQLYALSTGDPLQAMLIMVVFALGTLPSLLGIGVLTSSVRGQTRLRLNYAVGAIVIVLGYANLLNGATLLGFTGFRAQPEPGTFTPIILEDGSQRVEMEITPQGYSPRYIQVVEDIPVTWEVYGTEQLGCASTLVAATFDLNVQIMSGFNQIKFTPTEPGTYAFSCSIGMVRGVMVVLEKS